MTHFHVGVMRDGVPTEDPYCVASDVEALSTLSAMIDHFVKIEVEDELDRFDWADPARIDRLEDAGLPVGADPAAGVVVNVEGRRFWVEPVDVDPPVCEIWREYGFGGVL